MKENETETCIKIDFPMENQILETLYNMLRFLAQYAAFMCSVPKFSELPTEAAF